MKKIVVLIVFICSLSSTVFTQQLKPLILERKISVDYNKEKGTHIKAFKMCVGAGRANEGLRADWQQQLKMIQDEIGFSYIRFHGLLTDDMGIYREDATGNPEYNYQYVDVLFDFLLSVHIKPFVEFGFMPSALASGSQLMFWWEGNVTPPKSYERWADLIRNLVLHWEQRYGRDEVKTWYFEVWNEPDLSAFFSGTMEEYFKLYESAARAIKGICNEYRVGGPASASPYKYETAFVKHCAENNIPVDFVSTHCYGVKEGFVDENGNKGTLLDQDRNAITSRMIRSRELIDWSPLPHLELHFTEWSSSYTPADPIHDSYHSAAFILDKVKGTENHVTSLSYWVFTDIFEESGPRWTPFHGGFGMLNYQGIRKPAYYAFYFLGQMGETELVNSDPASWACRDDKGNIQVLLWDFTLTKPVDSVNNQVYYKRDLPAKPTTNVELTIAGVPDGNYYCQLFQVGYKVNDAYATYCRLGSPAQLTREQVNIIKKENSGLPVYTGLIEVENGKFRKRIDMRENDVFLLKLSSVK
ncbi:MAG: glycoside hydrolase [Bacteroidales bacterium]|nr:glycoside hydrolase [Bacteroidales bacterium]